MSCASLVAALSLTSCSPGISVAYLKVDNRLQFGCYVDQDTFRSTFVSAKTVDTEQEILSKKSGNYSQYC